MGSVKRAVLLLTILAVVLATVSFVLENRQGVVLSFLGWTTPAFPVSLFIMLSLITGLLVGPLLGFLFKNDRHGNSLLTKKN